MVQENRGISWTICLDPKIGWYQQNQVGFTQEQSTKTQHKMDVAPKYIHPLTKLKHINISIWSCSSNDISGYKKNIVLGFFFASWWRLKSHCGASPMTRGEVQVPGLGPAGVVNVLHEYDEILFCNDT